MSDPPPPPREPLLDHDFAPPDAPGRRGSRALLFAALVLVGLILTPPAVVLVLRWLPVPTSAFMLLSDAEPMQYQWVPAAAMPQALRRAVVAAEDQKFWTHNGFDFDAIAKAMEHNRRNRRVRGASTISQQVAKNLFLWPSRSYLRKGLEVTFTVLIELLWPKERILEVYLNIAEFGPGVYGAEAAARRFFHKAARQLTPAECAQLAAVLPNPRKWNAASPGRYVQARTDWILGQIGQRPRFSYFPLPEEPMPAEPVPSEPELEPAPEPDADPEADPVTPADHASPPQEPASTIEPAPDTPAGPDPMPPDDPAAEPQAAPAEEPATEPAPAP